MWLFFHRRRKITLLYLFAIIHTIAFIFIYFLYLLVAIILSGQVYSHWQSWGACYVWRKGRHMNRARCGPGMQKRYRYCLQWYDHRCRRSACREFRRCSIPCGTYQTSIVNSIYIIIGMLRALWLDENRVWLEYTQIDDIIKSYAHWLVGMFR